MANALNMDLTGARKEDNVKHRIWVNEQRTVLVTLWENGVVHVATREHASHTWGPPTTLIEEKQ